MINQHHATFAIVLYSTLFVSLSTSVATQSRGLEEHAFKAHQRLGNPFVRAERVTTAAVSFSDWRSSSAYQQEFNRQLANKFYPATVERRNQDGQSQFRAAFVPFPAGTFYFYSYHGMTRDFYQQRDAELSSAGYTKIHQQAFLDAAGVERFQVTWITGGGGNGSPYTYKIHTRIRPISFHSDQLFDKNQRRLK